LEAELVLALVPEDKDEVFQLQEEYEVVLEMKEVGNRREEKV
jgi:hypothetical protein